tara:strand:+ start:1806 stop:2750 length:945 start_codon:yes stop_codon:yes gene_type:complete
MSELKDALFKELVRKGYSICKEGRRVWDVANRSLLYMTPELAEAFLKVRSHPRYKATIIDIETGLLKDNADKFVKEFGEEPFNLIDMGCGDGIKAKVFIEALCGHCKLRYCPVNVNENLVNLALKNIKDEGFENVLDFKPHVSDLESLDEVASMMKGGEYQNNVILLLGSLLASFELHDYLFKLSRAMFKGDVLIIGNGVRTGERFVGLESYKHPLFGEWLSHLIREMGFEDSEVDYDARFENGRVEGFFRIKNDKKISHDGKEVEFKEGDEIVVATLYKYFEKELEEFCKMYFRDVEVVSDTANEYVLLLCKK